MSYRVRLSCSDCTGEDPLGCFDGGTELLNNGQEFATIEDAERAGDDETRGCAPWDYEIEEMPARVLSGEG
jgi:hypothetical protein